MKSISFLGPVGSYSHSVVQKLKGKFQGELAEIACSNFVSVFESVQNSKSDYLCVPVANTVEGSVNQVLDLLIKYDVRILGKIDLEVDNRLFVRCEHKEILKIATHPQAYAQCQETVRKMFPDAVFIPTLSTAKALEIIDEHTAAIAGVANTPSGCIMSKRCLNDYDENITTFLIAAKKECNIDASNKTNETYFDTHKKMTDCFSATQLQTAILFEAKNETGGLIRILKILQDFNLNMSSIFSRPYKGQPNRYLFFVDIIGSFFETADALKIIKSIAPTFKNYGSYGCG